MRPPLGMVELTGDERFVYDAYRRLVQMFGTVVLGLPDEAFEYLHRRYKENKGIKSDTGADGRGLERHHREVSRRSSRSTRVWISPRIPTSSFVWQPKRSFKSWNGKRAVDYRNAAGIRPRSGHGVNICTMVFGNMGDPLARAWLSPATLRPAKICSMAII